jgi:hypothetical protein
MVTVPAWLAAAIAACALALATTAASTLALIKAASLTQQATVTLFVQLKARMLGGPRLASLGLRYAWALPAGGAGRRGPVSPRVPIAFGELAAAI